MKRDKVRKDIKINIQVSSAHEYFPQLMLGQLDGKAKHFKSPGNSKSIVQEILNYTLIFRKF